MRQIEPIYVNQTGMAFFWKDNETVLSHKVQLVFKETGFYFTETELHLFKELIENCYAQLNCRGCERHNQVEKLLLRTPVSQIDLAVSLKELAGIRDLVTGTQFLMALKRHCFGVGRN